MSPVQYQLYPASVVQPIGKTLRFDEKNPDISQNDRKARSISIWNETILSKVGPGRLRLREKVKTASQPEYTTKFCV